jgi:hypothetical protein
VQGKDVIAPIRGLRAVWTILGSGHTFLAMLISKVVLLKLLLSFGIGMIILALL